jgi:hypothetical protein
MLRHRKTVQNMTEDRRKRRLVQKRTFRELIAMMRILFSYLFRAMVPVVGNLLVA